MSNNLPKKDLYKLLLGSIDNLYQVDENIKEEKVTLSSIVEFLTRNWQDVSKFECASNELLAYLDSYDFSNEFKFAALQNDVESLHSLRLLLVRMGEEAKKLSVYPDRYNSNKAIAICKELAVACSRRMSFREINKVSQLVSLNTQKLVEIQKLFERDADVLHNIKDIINAEAATLKTFSAYYAELMQYVSEFPHSAQNDLEVVKRRIGVARKIDGLKSTVLRDATVIQDYCDRYNKSVVLARFADIVHIMNTSMRFSDVDMLEGQLRDVQNQINEVVTAFERENKELNTMLSTLNSHSSGLWKEDNDQMVSRLKMLIKSDNKRTILDLRRLKDDIYGLRRKRVDEINVVKQKYSWLESRNFKERHDKLVLRYITSDSYHASIKEFKKEYLKEVFILLCIPIIGWIILLYRWLEK